MLFAALLEFLVQGCFGWLFILCCGILLLKHAARKHDPDGSARSAVKEKAKSALIEWLLKKGEPPPPA